MLSIANQLAYKHTVLHHCPQKQKTNVTRSIMLANASSVKQHHKGGKKKVWAQGRSLEPLSRTLPHPFRDWVTGPYQPPKGTLGGGGGATYMTPMLR